MNIKEPVELGQELANAFGLETESTQETAPEIIENTEITQEVIGEPDAIETTEELEGELEIPEISTQVVSPEKPKGTEQKIVDTKKVKVAVYKDKKQAAFNKYYNSVENPSLAEFERAWDSNYDNIEPKDMIRLSIEKDPANQGKPRWFIDREVEEKLSEFNLDTDDDNDRRYAELKLQREAERLKSEMIRTGKDFVSQFDSELEIEVDASIENDAPILDEATILAQREAYKAEFVEGFSKIVQNGVIQVKDSVSGSVINIPASNLGELAEVALTLQSKFQNPDGTANYQKLVQFLNYVNNEDAVHSAWFKHGYTSASKKITSQLKNKVDLANPRPPVDRSNITLESDPIEFLKGLQVVKK